jgi:esterase/lipase superfamily enzyme
MDPDRNYARMGVYYATDRAPAENFHAADQSGKYTGKRGAMAYGQAFVSIPRAHVAGELEAPSILRLEFREDPSKHVVLLETVPQRKDAFLRSIRARVAHSAGKNAFIFVHGYNVAFADAARRTAQLAYDLSFDGAPIFFSWPSQASLSGYTVDESNIEWATPHIKQFIVDAAEQSGAENLFLVGHSMGSRGLTRALASLMLERPDLRQRFREIILAAPDIDADVFRDQLAPALAQAGERVTLYASSKDLALKASKEVHGYARAGDSGDGIVVIEGIDTIDASNVDDSILAHSYFVESIPVIRDIAQMLRKQLPPKSRETLRPVRTDEGVHWLLDAD